MKTPLRSGGVIAIAATAIFYNGLLAEDANPEVSASFYETTSAEAKPYRSAGMYAINRLAMTMVQDCAAAVSQGTEVGALETFHLKDLPMKNGTVAGMPRITAVKLTSLKLRNPANAPDPAEKLALKAMQGQMLLGGRPEPLVQRIDLPSGEKEWRVYMLLANVRQCGSCHGQASEQKPELRTALQAKYPQDQGIGYGLGEWRGLIRVTVADPAVPPAAAPAAPASSPAPAKGLRTKK